MRRYVILALTLMIVLIPTSIFADDELIDNTTNEKVTIVEETSTDDYSDYTDLTDECDIEDYIVDEAESVTESIASDVDESSENDISEVAIRLKDNSENCDIYDLDISDNKDDELFSQLHFKGAITDKVKSVTFVERDGIIESVSFSFDDDDSVDRDSTENMISVCDVACDISEITNATYELDIAKIIVDTVKDIETAAIAMFG